MDTPRDPLERLRTPSADGRPALYCPDALLAAARKATGVTRAVDFRRDALETLCASFEESPLRLTFYGKKRAEGSLVDALSKRLLLEQYLAEFPAIRALAIERPILIVAPYRSGTTFLHRLLENDPDHRVPRIWETLQPPPRTPELQGDPRYLEEDRRIAPLEQFLAHRARRDPEMARLHPVLARSAEECYGLLETSLLSHSFLFHGGLTRYQAWLDERSDAEWRDAYRLYADQLRLLHWWAPGRRWVLKSPVHLWNVAALLEQFPDALVVQIHRRPAEVMASFCSLLAETHAAGSAAPHLELVGSIAGAFVRGALRRCAVAREHSPAERFVDVAFGRLLARPLEVVREIYAAAGAALAPTVEGRMRAWLAPLDSRPRGRTPPLSDFGLQTADVERDFACYERWAPTP